MNRMPKLTCLSLALLMAACAPSGYYDSNGVYRAYGQGDTARYNKPMAGTGSQSTVTTYTTTPETTTVIYKRPGYYDQNGYYIPADSGPVVAPAYLPPSGMCRIWFIDRPVSEEPAIESCSGIQNRVPAGAYVIYGG